LHDEDDSRVEVEKPARQGDAMRHIRGLSPGVGRPGPNGNQGKGSRAKGFEESVEIRRNLNGNTNKKSGPKPLPALPAAAPTVPFSRILKLKSEWRAVSREFQNIILEAIAMRSRSWLA
jgi:hypothetical protein